MVFRPFSAEMAKILEFPGKKEGLNHYMQLEGVIHIVISMNELIMEMHGLTCF